MAEFATSIDIDAEPGVVFDYLVTEAGLTAWMGQHAVLDARPGGGFAVDIAGHAVRGEYLEVERPHRVVVSWGVVGSADLPPGASTVEFTLVPIRHGTRVELTHADLPDAKLDGHADGWTHFLMRLRCTTREGGAGHDDWVPLEDRADHRTPS
ncbi:SRPBCC family protein [Nocardioides sp. LHG3406-4]|uniref:SRPBCC family protein n=1 Tax=Nocardioides sp. LHG3406-4 TaxID=2804575 RepID=UPI003CEEEBE3